MVDSLSKHSQTIKAGRLFLSAIFLLIGGNLLAQHSITIDTITSSKSYGHFLVVDDFPEPVQTDGTDHVFTTMLSVKVKGASHPLLGSYILSTDTLRFIPRFLPDPSVTYVVRYKSPTDDTSISQDVQFTSNNRPTQLTSIFPANSLPANALRIYLRFDQSMGLQNPFDFVQLTTDTGDIIKDAFVEYNKGLWNENRTRLTLLFHPGRIKQGVGPHTTMGSIFTPGETYILQISNGWKDQNGNALNNSQQYTWKITGAVRSKIKPTTWGIISPRHASDTLYLDGDRIMDEEIFNKSVMVTKNEEIINGQWKVIGTQYRFTHVNKWEPGSYQIVIPPAVEDASGNTLSAAFDAVGKMSILSADHKILVFHVE
jgi:hypothetical protein